VSGWPVADGVARWGPQLGCSAWPLAFARSAACFRHRRSSSHRPSPLRPSPARCRSYAVAHGAEGLEFVILELTPVGHIDAMGAHFFEELWASYRARGIQLVRGGRRLGWGPAGALGAAEESNRRGPLPPPTKPRRAACRKACLAPRSLPPSRTPPWTPIPTPTPTPPKPHPQVLSNPSPRVLRILERSGVMKKLGREWVFVRVHDAVLYCKSHTKIALGGGAGVGGDDIVVDASAAPDGNAKRRGSKIDAAAAAAIGADKIPE
jgi:hypothetical protein